MLKSEDIAEYRRRATQLHNFFIEKPPAGTYTSTKRNTVFVALCSLAIEHHGAIIVLTKDDQHIGSALALMRPQIESCLRAIWTLHCATDIEIDAVVKQTEDFPPLHKCSMAVSKFFENEGHPGLLMLPPDYRKHLHGLTHSGVEQLQLRIGKKLQVRPTYPPRTICNLLKGSSMWAAIAAIEELALIEGTSMSDANRFSQKFVEIFGDS
jgi:hypothetical protein